jgi:pantetheine-phosphate adenylyltransferase
MNNPSTTRRILYPGSFDPFTRGHLSLVRRALSFMDEVYIAIGINADKRPYFDAPARQAMIEAVFADEPRVHVITYAGMTVEACVQIQTNLILRGVRNTTDLEQEWAMATMNKELANVETIFLPTDKEWAHLSSSFIRDLLRHGSDVSPYLPPEILKHLTK